ncbi:MAG: hypothetical protein V1660_02195 [archaeon]
MPKNPLRYQKGKKSAATRKKISATLKEYFKTHPSPFKGKKHSAAKKREMSRLKIEFLRQNPSWAAKKSKEMKKYCKKNPEFMRKAQKISIGYMRKHPEILERRAESIRLRYKNDKKLIKRISFKLKEKWKDPTYANLVDSRVTAWWREHPNMKKERAEEAREYFLAHPEDFREKFLNAKSNPFKCHIMTRQGFKVRSKGEKKIADYLFEKGIECEYESENFILEGWACTPDFYLPDYDYYIEFYGGFPGSRPKKVLKNRLYPKYSVACIFITPDELRDLDTAIKKELRRSFGEGSV